MEGEGKREPMEGDGNGAAAEGEGSEPMEGEGAQAEIDSETVNTNGGRLQLLVVIICFISGLVGFSAARLLITSYFQWGAHTQLLQWLLIDIVLPILLLPILDPQNRSLFVSTKYIIVCQILGAVAIMITPFSSTSPTILFVISFVYGALFASLSFQHGITTRSFRSLIFLLATVVEPRILSSDENPEGGSRGHFILGFVFTILACATAGLVFPLGYLALYRVTGEDTLAIFCMSLSFAIAVANMVSIVGLLINGDFEYLMSEDRHARPEEPDYWVTFIYSVLDWQLLFLAIQGLVYLEASLYFNGM